MKLLEKPIVPTVGMLRELSAQGECVVLCYNQAEVWGKRKDAIEFYREAVYACDGCEKERYLNVLVDLLSGFTVCDDGVTQMLTRETDYR